MTTNNLFQDYLWNKISYCEITFDFKKVQKVMSSLNWGWGPKNVIPTVDGLQQAAVDLLCRTYKRLVERNVKEQSMATGGFKATWSRNEDGTLDCSLEFVLTESSSNVYAGEELPPLPAQRKVRPGRSRSRAIKC